MKVEQQNQNLLISYTKHNPNHIYDLMEDVNDISKTYNCSHEDIENRRRVIDENGNILPFSQLYCEEQWRTVNSQK